jgi:hypothetical protein
VSPAPPFDEVDTTVYAVRTGGDEQVWERTDLGRSQEAPHRQEVFVTYTDEPIPPADTPPGEQAVTPDGVDAAEVAEAMAVYSADGQVDDRTGGDAGAEAMRARDDSADTPTRPAPDAGSGPV